MSPTIVPVSCAHERGPGISVCLRCRAESNSRAAARVRRVVFRAGAAAVGVAVLFAMGAGALANREKAATVTTPAGDAPMERFTVQQAAAQPVTARTSAPERATIATGVEMGRTDLARGIHAIRTNDGVTVHFDSPDLRTRRRDKLEATIRATLPAVHGPQADSLLARIAPGQLLPAGDLLTELTARGIPVGETGGQRITLWPGTRPGQDGPLVISYRIALTPVK